MLSIGKLGRGQEGYYLSAVAQGVEDYYTGDGEAPGEWLGAGAARLGLTGQVDPETLRAVLGGKAPDGTPLNGGTRRDRVPGWDLTFSAPKSVSVLYGLGGPDIAADVVEAHRTAVLAGIEYLERHALMSRRRIDGTITQVKGAGLVIAGFRHRTSRAGDPQLHTHCLAANVVEHDAGWGAVHSPELYRHARTAGFVYQAILRSELSLRLGVSWGTIAKGSADIDGIDPGILRTFSKRRAEIEAALANAGEESPAAAEIATLTTRRAKTQDVDPQGLADRWVAEAAAEGLPLELQRVLHQPQPTVGARQLDEVADDLLSARGLTHEHASFDRKDVVRGWCEGLPPGTPLTLETIEELTEGLLEDDNVIALAVERPQRWSTVEMLNIERRLLDRAEEGIAAGLAVVDQAVVEDVAAKHRLSVEQAGMVDAVCRSGRAIDVVVGRAGTGKTYALAAAAAAWRASGLRPIGVALAARAATELETSTGMPTTTAERFLIDCDRYTSGALTADNVVVVDEAGMVDTRRLARILTHAHAAGAKTMLVGDHHQLPSVEAGGAFDALVRRLPSIELTENHRQIEAWERAALDQLREGRNTPEVLDLYDRNGRLHIAATPNDARATLVDDWLDSRHAGRQPLMLALRHSDVHDLNARARALLVAHGDLPSTSTIIGGTPFAPADEVICLQNDRRFGVHNALFATITDIDEAGRWLHLATKAGASATVPFSYVTDRHLTHAYATTIHKAQGATYDHALLLGDDRLYRQAAYTALSRGRIRNDIYAVTDPTADQPVELHAPADISDPLDRLRVAFTRNAAKELAVGRLAPIASMWELDSSL